MFSSAEAFAKKAMAAALTLVVASGPGVLPAAAATPSPVKHVVVIFQENVSFDHYFATYPKAKNSAGEPAFHALSNTPSVNGLTAGLLTHNPNSHQPFRLSRAQNYTCDQDHDYKDEQESFDRGLMDKFVEFTGAGGPGCPDYGFGKALVMGYYDGNTVTGLWNYAQHYSMSDNSFDTEFGPSTVGAINLISGQTAGVNKTKGTPIKDHQIIDQVVIGDPDPLYDDCGSFDQVGLSGKNIGDLLNAKNLTWGWFQGGFKPSQPASGNAPAVCGNKTPNLSGALQTDYSAHHEPFEYYPQTANPHHLPPSSVAMIGQTDQANHQYDLTDFWNAVNNGNMPAVSFLKAKKAQDGHAGYSSPLDEQQFLVNTLNTLQQRPEWASSVVIIMWDDSDGWYDHQMGPIVNQSVTSQDALSAAGHCGTVNTGGIPARCGYGVRLPMLVISPFAKSNFVDGTTTDHTSAIRFIEDNWGLGRIGGHSFDAIAGPLTNMLDFREPRTDILILDPDTGQPVF